VTLEVGPPAFFVSGIILRPGREEPASGVPVSVNYFQEGEQGWDRIRSVNGFAFPEMPGNSLATTSEKDGRFRILLARGDERFGHIEGGFLRIRAGSFKEGWSEDLVFPFTKGTVLSGLRVEILTPGSIEGHVARADGEPALSELVAAYDGHGILRWVISGEDGNYRIDGLRPGDHAIEALGRVFSPLQGGGSGGPSKIEGMPAPHELFRRPVRVEAGKVTTWNIDLAKDRLGEVQGRLLGCLPGDGEVHYSMVIAGQACVPRCLGGGVRASAGEFALKNLLPGTYRFWIESDSATQAEALADVSRGEVSHVALSSP